MGRNTMTTQTQESKMTLAEFMALEFTYSDVEGYKHTFGDANGSATATSICDTVLICFNWHAAPPHFDIKLGLSECDCDYSVSGVALIDEHGDPLEEYDSHGDLIDDHNLFAAIDKKLNGDAWETMVRDTVLTDIIHFHESESN